MPHKTTNHYSFPILTHLTISAQNRHQKRNVGYSKKALSLSKIQKNRTTTMDFLLELGYIGLFIGSFLAATIFPFSADVLLIGMLVAGGNGWIVVAVATAGNFLGGLTSYGIGRLGKWEWIERLGIKPETLEKQKAKIDKYGSLIALLSWVPFIGDVFAVALGFYRTKFIRSAIFMFIGKCGRFIAWYLIYTLF